MNAVAVIPARGGSKRVPRKNIRDLDGRPVISRTIETCVKSGAFSHVIVSTDDGHTAEIAAAAGAEVPFLRPPALADDFTPLGDVMSHAILDWERQRGISAQTYCCVYATACMLEPDVLLRAAAALGDSSLEFAFGALRCPPNTARAFTCSDTGTQLLKPEFAETRTQDLPDVFVDAGQFCFGLRSAWLEGRPVLGGRSIPIEVPHENAVDLDTEEDWDRLVEAYARSHASRD